MFAELLNSAIRKSLNIEVATSLDQKISALMVWPCKQNASETASQANFI